MAQALHEEYISDPQGRRVRAKHAARYEVDGKQQTFWMDIRDKNPATRRHMQIAFQNRRQQIVGECVQLKLDIDSYNQNWNSGALIQGCFDFTDDLADRGLAETRVSQAVFRQRDSAAFFAISLRFLAVRFLARALPPLLAPSLLRACAAAFLTGGLIFSVSPVVTSKIYFAN